MKKAGLHYCVMGSGLRFCQTSLHQVESECFHIKMKKHLLCRIKSDVITDGAADFGALVTKMAMIVFFQNTENLSHLVFVNGMHQNFRNFETHLLAVIAKDGESTVPRSTELAFKNSAELLFTDEHD